MYVTFDIRGRLNAYIHTHASGGIQKEEVDHTDESFLNGTQRLQNILISLFTKIFQYQITLFP